VITDLQLAWQLAKAEHRHVIVFSAETAALVGSADALIRDQLTEIARLRAELDTYRGHSVFLCPDAIMDDLATVQAVYCDEAGEGDILRATGSGRELELRGGVWLPR
jgi:hypothetical protein